MAFEVGFARGTFGFGDRVVDGYNAADSKFPRNAEGEGGYYCARTEIGELVAVVSYTFLAASVAICEDGVG